MAYFRLSFRIWIIWVLSDGDLHIYFCYTLSKFFKSSFLCSTSNLQWSPVNTVTNGPKKLAVLMGDRNNEGVFLYKKIYGRFSRRPKKVAVITKWSYYRGDCKAGFPCICFAVALLFEKNTASGGVHFIELVSGSPLLVQRCFHSFRFPGSPVFPSLLSRDHSEICSAGASDQETERRRPS